MKRLSNSFLIILLLLTGSTLLFGKEKPPGLRRTGSTLWTSTHTWLNVNGISTIFRNDGQADRTPGGNSAFVFPKGTGRTAIFESGLLWGAKVGDSLRMAGSVYHSGLQPGKILAPGVAEDPNLPKNRIYRVRHDYATADLSVEAGEEGRTQDQVRAQYALDWNQWPAVEGAPFQDRNGNGMYEPGIDIPGKPGADQTIWYVANDLDSALARAFYGTRPMGVEVQVTFWSYARAGALGNVLFKRYRLINKSAATYDSMYVCQWADTDLGDPGDDYAGSDTTLAMNFTYNGGSVDNVYHPLVPPALGFLFLNEAMYSAIYDAAGNPTFLPPTGRYEGALHWYNYFRGLTPISGTPFVHPLFPGMPTRYWLDGDPVTGTGRVDGMIDAAGDRRISTGSGPFTMPPADTQDIDIAVLAGIGPSYISSITTLRNIARAVRVIYNGIAASAPPIVIATVSFPTGSDAGVQIVADGRPARAQSVVASLKRQNGSVASSFALFDDGLHDDSLAHDGIWGNSVTIPREAAGLYADVSLVDSSSRSFEWPRSFEDLSIAGPAYATGVRVFADNLNNDGVVNPGENVRLGITVANSTPFPLSALSVQMVNSFGLQLYRFGSINPQSTDSMVYNPSDPYSYFVIDAPPVDTTIFLRLALADTSSNTWSVDVPIQVIPFATPTHGSPVTHVTGLSEWKFRVMAVDQNSLLNHSYEISIIDSLDSNRTKGFTLRDLTAAATLLTDHPLPDEFSHNIPVTQGFKLLQGENFDVLGLRRDSTRWISVSPPWFRGDRFSYDSHSAFGGGATTGSQLPLYLGAIQSNYDPSRSITVEVRFDSTNPQRAYRLRRIGSYFLQDFVNIPFTVWDVMNPSNPRQMTVAWRDQNNNGIWDPLSLGSVEVVFIYYKTYDPTGSQFILPAIPNECTIGPKADIVYGMSVSVLDGHVLNESAGTLYLRPMYALNSDDRFTFNPTVVLSVPEDIPTTFTLLQNYPNPFNPSTTIKYELASASMVSIRVYDILGREIKTLVNEIQATGVKSVQWNGLNSGNVSVATGVYFYRIEATSMSDRSVSFTQVKKMMLLR